MRENKKGGKENVEEIAVLILEISHIIKNRLSGKPLNQYGTKMGTEATGKFRFVETYDPNSEETQFSIWCFDREETEALTYKFDHGNVSKIDSGKLVEIRLEELRMVKNLVVNPTENAGTTAKLPRLSAQ